MFQSSGPARKATLINQLTYHHINEGSDVRDHFSKFFETVDKLAKMDVDMNSDLLSVMMLHSLSQSFENFWCTIESREALPLSETLKLKIIEESESRKHKDHINKANVIFVNKKKFGKGKGAAKKMEIEEKKCLCAYRFTFFRAVAKTAL